MSHQLLWDSSQLWIATGEATCASAQDFKDPGGQMHKGTLPLCFLWFWGAFMSATKIGIYIKTFNDLMFMKSYQEITMAWNRAGNVYLVKSSFASTECLPLFGNQISPEFVPINWVQLGPTAGESQGKRRGPRSSAHHGVLIFPEMGPGCVWESKTADDDQLWDFGVCSKKKPSRFWDQTWKMWDTQLSDILWYFLVILGTSIDQDFHRFPATLTHSQYTQWLEVGWSDPKLTMGFAGDVAQLAQQLHPRHVPVLAGRRGPQWALRFCVSSHGFLPWCQPGLRVCELGEAWLGDGRVVNLPWNSKARVVPLPRQFLLLEAPLVGGFIIIVKFSIINPIFTFFKGFSIAN